MYIILYSFQQYLLQKVNDTERFPNILSEKNFLAERGNVDEEDSLFSVTGH